MANSKAVEAAYKIDHPAYAMQGIPLDVFKEEHPDEYKEMMEFTVPIIESANADLLDAVGQILELREWLIMSVPDPREYRAYLNKKNDAFNSLAAERDKWKE